MNPSMFRRAFELLLCFAIAFAFVGSVLWLLGAQAGRWHLAHCFGQPGASFMCALSAVFIQYWWLTTVIVAPLLAIGLFVLLGRREPQ